MKMTKDQIKRKQDLHAELDAAQEALNDAIGQAHQILKDAEAKARELLEKPLDDLRALKEQADEFAGELAGDINAFIDERSEKWQEGPKGEAYTEWADSCESWDNSLDELPDPDTIVRGLIDSDEFPMESMAEAFSEIPEEAPGI